MSLPIVISPSNLSTYCNCPHKFYQQYILKTIPFQDSPATIRGKNLHGLFEQACKDGWESIVWPEPHTATAALGFVHSIKNLKEAGWTVHNEYEACTDGNGNATTWWDKLEDGNYMRSRLDVFAHHPSFDYAYIFDLKTGRKYGVSRQQLLINAMCLTPIVPVRRFIIANLYLDSNEVVSEEITVDIEKPREYKQGDKTIMADVLDAICNMKKSYETNTWEQTRNKFCHWCTVPTCKYSG